MLTFNLKKEWFEKIKSGEKTHEYREVKPYWVTRIKNYFGYLWCDIDYLKGGDIYYPILKDIIFQKGYTGEKLYARVVSIKIVDGTHTDLKIDSDVFDIEFEQIKNFKRGEMEPELKPRIDVKEYVDNL